MTIGKSSPIIPFRPSWGTAQERRVLLTAGSDPSYRPGAAALAAEKERRTSTASKTNHPSRLCSQPREPPIRVAHPASASSLPASAAFLAAARAPAARAPAASCAGDCKTDQPQDCGPKTTRQSPPSPRGQYGDRNEAPPRNRREGSRATSNP